MSTITREQAQKIIAAADEVITALAGTNEDVHPESDNMLRLWDDLNDRYAPPEVVRELARIALASLEAEAVACPKCNGTGMADSGGVQPWGEPISVPCDCTDQVSLVHVPDEKVKGNDFELDGPLSCYQAGKIDGWNACRAAMLQGADGNSPVIPDGWVACSERMPEGMQTVITSNGFDIGQGWWDGDEWKQWSHHDAIPGVITHWMSLPAAPQQEA
ncbi:DUF551 domain-containing protein [Enterobacter ludwigii]|nr:DUF551 domain-containing protein [Enterobacter ludwigii]